MICSRVPFDDLNMFEQIYWTKSDVRSNIIFFEKTSPYCEVFKTHIRHAQLALSHFQTPNVQFSKVETWKINFNC